MAIERSNPAALANPPGYSHVVKDGTTVYVAGQLSRNSAGETVGAGDFEAQAEQEVDIVLWDGDPFEPQTRIQAVMLEGRFVSGELAE